MDQVNRTVLGFLFTILIEHFSARHQAFAEAWGESEDTLQPREGVCHICWQMNSLCDSLKIKCLNKAYEGRLFVKRNTIWWQLAVAQPD